MTAPHPATTELPELTVESVQGIRGERMLFNNLSFTLKPGALLHVTGPNGSGKTTLLRILCGLLAPDEGAVLWRGVDIRQSATRYRRESTYVGHRDGLKAELTAMENLEITARMYGDCEPRTLQQALRVLGLEDCQDLIVGKLSAGQRRRLALSRQRCNAFARARAAGVRIDRGPAQG